MHKKKIEVDIKVPNQTRYLSLIGKIGEDIAKELDKFDGDRDTLAYHLNLVLTEAMANAINTIPAPNFEQLEDRGRGIFIIKSLMDKVNYRKHGKGNVLEMAKKLT